MFDLLEQSKRLFTGEFFSYFEAADNVHIEISTSVHMLPSTTDMLNIIDNISARDTMSITIKSVVSFRYNTGSEDWESSYTDFIEQCDPEDQADIKIHVKKEFANNTLSIYSFDMFWEYYGTGEGKDKIIPFFSDCLKKHPYLRFDVFDKPVKLVTDSIDNTTEMPIRLHYVWFKDNNTFFNQGINFSSKYNFSYDSVSGKLKVTGPKNDKYVDDFFGNNIDVTAIVGQNGAGKTTLLKFIQSLGSGVISEDSVVVCEKDSNFWAARYYSDGRVPTRLHIEGNNIANIVELDIKPEESTFPFKKDIRFIYMTEMFNMSQYESPTPGISSGDDMSFAAVLYRQSEYGYEEKHTINPVTRYIHRITDWQLDFISNGAKFVEKFDITYPKVLTIKPNYDTFAFEKLYMAVKGKVQGKIRQSSNNEYEDEYGKEATILSKKWFGTSKNLKDEYAKAIIMNIISSCEYYTDASYPKRKNLYDRLECCYSSGLGTWASTKEFLRVTNTENNEHNDRNTKDKSRFYINARSYIEFMKYLENFFEGKNPNRYILFDINIPTSDMTIIYDFVKEYRKCVLMVDFLSFSWGLSSGENLLLNQFGKLMHLFRKDNNGYFLPADINSVIPAKNAVIMLDEAEVAFHPEWQRRYFNAFLNFINQNIVKHGTAVVEILLVPGQHHDGDIPHAHAFVAAVHALEGGFLTERGFLAPHALFRVFGTCRLPSEHSDFPRQVVYCFGVVTGFVIYRDYRSGNVRQLRQPAVFHLGREHENAVDPAVILAKPELVHAEFNSDRRNTRLQCGINRSFDFCFLFDHRVSFRLHSQKCNGFVYVRAFNVDVSWIVHQIAEPDYPAAVDELRAYSAFAELLCDILRR